MEIADKKEVNTICVYGVGGVGGYFGGKIAHTIAGRAGDSRKVFFVARGRHLEEIKRNGLILNTTEKLGMECRPFLATDNIEEVPAPDLCLLCVKSYDLSEAVRALSKRVSGDTVVIPLLNGIDIYERIRSVLHEGVVLPACAYVSTHIEKPGMVTQRGAEGIILCGKDPGNPAFNAEPIIHFFNDMNIRFNWIDDPFPAIWEKYIFIAGYGLVTAYSGKTLGEVLSEDVISASLEKAKRFPFETKTSYQRDVETQGRRNEGDLFGETIVRMGKATGVSTVVTQSVYLKIQHKDL